MADYVENDKMGSKKMPRKNIHVFAISLLLVSLLFVGSVWAVTVSIADANPNANTWETWATMDDVYGLTMGWPGYNNATSDNVLLYFKFDQGFMWEENTGDTYGNPPCDGYLYHDYGFADGLSGSGLGARPTGTEVSGCDERAWYPNGLAMNASLCPSCNNWEQEGTWSMWVWIPSDATNGNYDYSIKADSSNRINLGYGSGQIKWEYTYNGTLKQNSNYGSSLNDDDWHLVTTVWDASTGYISHYIDGVFQANSVTDFAGFGSTYNTGSTEMIASSNWDQSGVVVDEWIVFDYAKSADEILADYNKHVAYNYSEVGYASIAPTLMPITNDTVFVNWTATDDSMVRVKVRGMKDIPNLQEMIDWSWTDSYKFGGPLETGLKGEIDLYTLWNDGVAAGRDSCLNFTNTFRGSPTYVVGCNGNTNQAENPNGAYIDYVNDNWPNEFFNQDEYMVAFWINPDACGYVIMDRASESPTLRTDSSGTAGECDQFMKINDQTGSDMYCWSSNAGIVLDEWNLYVYFRNATGHFTTVYNPTHPTGVIGNCAQSGAAASYTQPTQNQTDQLGIYGTANQYTQDGYIGGPVYFFNTSNLTLIEEVFDGTYNWTDWTSYSSTQNDNFTLSESVDYVQPMFELSNLTYLTEYYIDVTGYEYPAAPSAPTSITCDGGTCNTSLAGTVEIACDGATDVNGDTITYYVEYGNYNATAELVTEVIDYEGFTTDTGDWNQATFDTDNWLRKTTAPADSSGTGPESLWDGAYMVTETSSGQCNTPDTAVLYLSPAIDFDSVYEVNVSFAANMYGSTMGALSVKENSTGSWVTVWTLSGNQGTAWFEVNANITGATGTGNIAIWADCGASYQSDQAVDSVNVTKTYYGPGYDYTAIGSHVDGSSYSWDTTSLIGDTLEAFRCRATDGISGYSDYYTVEGYTTDIASASGNLPPTSSIEYPSAGTYNQLYMNFSLLGTDALNSTLEAVLFIDGVANQTNNSMINNTSWDVNVSMAYGTYTAILQVCDTDASPLCTNSSSVTFTLENGVPDGAPTDITCDGGTCTGDFSGSVDLACTGATDPDGDTLTYYLHGQNETELINDDAESSLIGTTWTATSTDGTYYWIHRTDGVQANSGTGSYYGNDTGLAESQALLTSPTYDLSEGSADGILSFWLYVNSEDDYDGCYLEYSIGGGAWTLWDNSLLDYDYPDTMDGYQSRASWGWNGNLGAHVVNATFPAASYGSNFTFRFVMESDTGYDTGGSGENNDDGCWIDDITVNYNNSIYLGSHTAGSAYSFDTSSYAPDTFEGFACRAADVTGTNTNTSFYYEGAIFNMTAVGGSTCTYTSGDWNIVDEICTVSSPVDVGTNSVNLQGTSGIILSSTITLGRRNVSSNSYINITTGGKFNWTS